MGKLSLSPAWAPLASTWTEKLAAESRLKTFCVERTHSFMPGSGVAGVARPVGTLTTCTGTVNGVWRTSAGFVSLRATKYSNTARATAKRARPGSILNGRRIVQYEAGYA